MLIIPTGTDAPIYHWPLVTVGLIVLNIAVFFAVPPCRATSSSTRMTRWWRSSSRPSTGTP